MSNAPRKPFQLAPLFEVAFDWINSRDVGILLASIAFISGCLIIAFMYLIGYLDRLQHPAIQAEQSTPRQTTVMIDAPNTVPAGPRANAQPLSAYSRFGHPRAEAEPAVADSLGCCGQATAANLSSSGF